MAPTSGPAAASDCAGACQFQFDHSGYRPADAPMTITARKAPRSRLCLSRSSGSATAPAAIAAMTAATTRNVFIVYLIDSRSRGGLIIERHARTLARDAVDDDAAQQQHDEGSAPNQQGFGFQRWA